MAGESNGDAVDYGSIDYGYEDMENGPSTRDPEPVSPSRRARRRRQSSVVFHTSLRQSLRRESVLSFRRQSLVPGEQLSTTEPGTTTKPAAHYYASWLEAVKYFVSLSLLVFSIAFKSSGAGP